MADSIWESEIVIGEVKKNSREKIVVKKVTKSGKEYKDVRVYYLDGEDYKPSSKGIVIPVGEIESIIDLLKQ